MKGCLKYKERLEVDYGELCELITNGLLRHEKNAFIGMALIKGNINTFNQDEWDERLHHWLNQMAHNVVMNLKKKFNEHLIITEEGHEI